MTHISCAGNSCIPYPEKLWGCSLSPLALCLGSCIYIASHPSPILYLLEKPGASHGWLGPSALCLPTAKKSSLHSPAASAPSPERAISFPQRSLFSHPLPSPPSLTLPLSFIWTKNEDTRALPLENLHPGVCCQTHHWILISSYEVSDELVARIPFQHLVNVPSLQQSIRTWHLPGCSAK